MRPLGSSKRRRWSRFGLIREWRAEHRADRADLAARVARIESHLGLPPA